MDGRYLKVQNVQSTQGKYWYYMKIRNTGTKSCGPFEVKLSYYFHGPNPAETGSGWISGLSVDEEKVLKIIAPNRPPNYSEYQIIIDVNNEITELDENNNIIRTGITTFYGEGEIE